MSTDYTIKQTQQPTYTTCEQKTSSSDVSVWNNPRAMESTNNKEQTVYYKESNSIEDMYKQFIENIISEYDGSTEQEIIDILTKLGFTLEFVSKLSKEDFDNFMRSFEKIFEFIYVSSGDKEQKINNISDMINYSNAVSEKLEVLNSVTQYAEKIDNATFYYMIKCITEKSGIKDIKLSEEFLEKLKKVDNISELSADEVNAIVMTLVSHQDILKEQKDVDTEQLLLFIFFNIPESYMVENPVLQELLLEKVESAIKAKNADNKENSIAFLAMLQKLSNNKDGLTSACNNNMINTVIDSIKTPEQAEKFLLCAQEIIDSGNVKQKSILANAIANNLKTKLEYVNTLETKLENGTELDKQEKDFLDIFEKFQQKFEAFAGYSFVRAEKNIATSLHEEGDKINNGKFNKGAYQRAYNYSLKDKNVDPIDVTQKIDEISSNQYSQVLQELGYELPTTDNINRLRDEAEQGVFDEKISDYYDSERNTNSFGYTQDSQIAYNNAYSNIEAFRLQIINSSASEQNNFTVEGNPKTEKQHSEQKNQVNKANLSNYSGKELSDMIANGLMKFSDAVKQYTTHLSESGKRFVVQSIKIMDDGRQTFALNSTSNTARWEIMKKANLLGEDLKVDFDYNHEILRENYQA